MFLMLACICGIGNAAVDLSVPVEKMEMEGVRLVSWVEFSSLPKEVQIATGGSAANVMKGLAKLGVKTRFLGKIGSDEKGEYFHQKLLSYQVEPHLLVTETPTTQIACLVSAEGQKAMIVYPGAGAELSESDLSPLFFEEKEWLHIDGYMLWNQNLFSEALKMAKTMGLRVSIDLGCTELMEQYREKVLELLPKYVDVVFGNQAEIETLIGLPFQEAMDSLRKLCPVIVGKVGAEGAWIGTKDELFHSPAAFAEQVVDTTGAGDAFASGFLYGLINNLPLIECGRLGNLLGSAAVEVYGAEIPEEKWKKISWNEKHLILIGPPGAGKGTLSRHLSTHGRYYSFSYGDAVREEIRNETPFGLMCKEFVEKGEIVPMDLSTAFFREHFEKAVSQGKLFIVDGMIVNQAFIDFFDQFAKEKGFDFGYIVLKGDRETCESRIAQRIGRVDDADDIVVKRRLDRYFLNILPLVDQYRERPSFLEIDAEQDIDTLLKTYDRIFLTKGFLWLAGQSVAF